MTDDRTNDWTTGAAGASGNLADQTGSANPSAGLTDQTGDATASSGTDNGGSRAGSLKSAANDAASRARKEAASLRTQAGDKARNYAVDGKERASGALDGFAELLEDAADQIDEKLGSQYGTYARRAADTVSGFASSLRDRDVDDLMEDARVYVRKSPAVAIGAAAAIGFVLARLVKSGMDDAKTLGTDPDRAKPGTKSDNDVAFTPASDLGGTRSGGGQPL